MKAFDHLVVVTSDGTAKVLYGVTDETALTIIGRHAFSDAAEEQRDRHNGERVIRHVLEGGTQLPLLEAE